MSVNGEKKEIDPVADTGMDTNQGLIFLSIKIFNKKAVHEEEYNKQ